MSSGKTYNSTRVAAALMAALLGALLGLTLAIGVTTSAHAIKIGTPGSTTVEGQPVCGTAPTTNQLLVFNGAQWCATSEVLLPAGAPTLATNQNGIANDSIGLEIGVPASQNIVFTQSGVAPMVAIGGGVNLGMVVGAGTGFKGDGTVNAIAGYFNNSKSAVEFALSAGVNTFGTASTFPTGAVLNFVHPVNNGTFAELTCQNVNAGTCTTAPTVQVRNFTTLTNGTSLTCAVFINAVTQTQTLAFTAGDLVGITIGTQGGTCSTPNFAVTAMLKEP